MPELRITSVSSKGQVVIPGPIRQQLHLRVGAKLMVMTDGENVLLKPVQPPEPETFAALVAESRKAAKAAGLEPADLTQAIRSVRRAGRS